MLWCHNIYLPLQKIMLRPFHGIAVEVIYAALNSLQRQNKAEVLLFVYTTYTNIFLCVRFTIFVFAFTGLVYFKIWRSRVIVIDGGIS